MFTNQDMTHRLIRQEATRLIVAALALAIIGAWAAILLVGWR